MADNTIDTLQLEIKSNSNQATKALDNLSKTLYSLNKSFKSTNSGGMRNFAREVGRVSASVKALSGLKLNTNAISGISKEFQNLGKKLTDIDTNKIQSTSNAIEKVSESLSLLNGLNLKDSKINLTLGALKRLAEVDMSKFDASGISGIIASISELSRVPEVSSGVNRFVSSFARLANAGEKTGKSASGIANLGNQVKKTIINLSGVGEISDSLNLFVQSVGRLATAGEKAGETAIGLKTLSVETRSFFDVMKDAPEISENTIRMTEALAHLASAGGKVGVSANTISKSIFGISKSSGIAKASFNVLVKTAKFAANQIVKLAGKISSAFKSIISSSRGLNRASLNLGTLLKTALGFRLGYGLLNFGKSAIGLGSDITEVQNVVDVAFGSMSGMVEDFANTSIENFGLSKTAAKEYSGILMSMFKSSGFNSSEMRQQAAEMSIALTGLAGDLASFYNIRTEDAFYKLRAAMAGEIEPMRQLGVNMNIANLEAYALANGINKSYQSMSQAEQQLLRYNYLMAVTGAQQGDFARTSVSWANQTRILAENFKYLSAVIGQGLIAAVLPGIQALNALMGKLIQVAETFRNFVYTLMGKKLEGSQGGIVNDLAGIGDTSYGLENLGTAGGDAASGMEDATGAAHDLKKALSVLSFDELNQLSESASSAGGALGGIGGGGGLDNIQTPTFGGLSDALDDAINSGENFVSLFAHRIRKAIKSENWQALGIVLANELNKGLQKVYDVISWKNVGPKITEFTTAFTETFNSLVTHFDWDLLGRTVGAGVNTIVNTLNQLADGIDWINLGSKMAEGFNGLFDEIDWKNLGHLIGNKFRIAWDMFAGFVENLDYADIGRSVAELLTGAFETVSFGDIGTALSNLMNGAFESLRTFTETFEWQDFADNVAEGISNFLQNTEWKENGEALGEFLTKLGSALKSVITNDTFYDLGKGIGDFIGALPWSELLVGAAETIIEGISSLLQGLWDSDDEGKIAAGISGAFLAIKAADITGISTLASKIIEHMIDKIQDQKQIDKMTEAFKKIFSTSSQNASTVVTEELGKIGGSVDEVGGKAVKTGGFLSTLKNILMGGGKPSGTAGIIGAIDLFNKGQKDAELYSSGALDAISVVGNAIMEAGEKSGTSAWQMSQLQGQLYGFQNGSLTFEEAFGKIIKNLDNAGISSDEFKSALGNAMQQMGLTTGEYAEVIQTYIGQVGGSFENASAKSESMKNSVTNNTNSMKSNVSRNLSRIRSDVGTSFGEVNDTTVLNWGNSAREVTLKLREMKLAASTELGNMTETVRSFSESMYNIMTKKFEYLANRIKQIIEAMDKDVGSVFDTMLSGLSENIRSSTSDIIRSFSRIPREISYLLGDNMYNAGRNAAISFANGISSVHIPMPHISVDANTWSNGSGYSYRMSSSVNWYKAGGLFGVPSVIGVGEAGKEAVLPLENKRTMSMIADSIMSRAPQGSLDQQTIENAVAKGVAMAMMNNQQNPINVTCYAELKTEDNEVLARAVTKGQKSIDRRLHPTLQFGY